jgi:ATP-dependent Clp protease adaptor protein ClpS
MAQQNSSAGTGNSTGIDTVQQQAPGAKTTATKPGRSEKTERRDLPPFNVILLNDDDHTYPYVVEMLQRLFGHSEQFAYRIAKTVDHQGRAIVLTTHQERAEFKRDQIRGFGSDPRIASSKCSMGATVEPAE